MADTLIISEPRLDPITFMPTADIIYRTTLACDHEMLVSIQAAVGSGDPWSVVVDILVDGYRKAINDNLPRLRALIASAGVPPVKRYHAVVCVLDEPTATGRIYPYSVLRSEVVALEDDMVKRRLLGTLGSPADAVIRLSDASHVVVDIYFAKPCETSVPDDLFVGDKSCTKLCLIAVVEMLSTPSGKILAGMLEDIKEFNFHYAFQLYGTGAVTNGVVTKFKLVQIFVDASRGQP